MQNDDKKDKNLKFWSELSPIQQALRGMLKTPSVTVSEALELNKDFLKKFDASEKKKLVQPRK
jgi:hypothetical protein